MIEFLDHTVAWWFWVIGGLILIILELATGSFITLGLGIAAVLVGVIDLIIPIGLLFQLLLWILFSVVLITLFFKWFKKQESISNIGQSSFGLDTIGTVTTQITPPARGKVLFDEPLLGSRSWSASSEHTIEIGTKVTILIVNGQIIKVVPIHKSE